MMEMWISESNKIHYQAKACWCKESSE